jgi:hypothetical protein
MKIETTSLDLEIGDNAFYATLIVAIMITILGTIALFSHYHNARLSLAFSAGYEETQSIGEAGTRWTRPTAHSK